MIKKTKLLIYFLIFILFANCSFHNTAGIWSGEKEEKTHTYQKYTSSKHTLCLKRDSYRPKNNETSRHEEFLKVLNENKILHNNLAPNSCLHKLYHNKTCELFFEIDIA